jgi:hypothetical protein
MKKMVWVLIIAAGVFLGMFAYEKFTGQEIHKSQQLDLGDIQDELQGIEADQKKHQQAEDLAKNAVCTINAEDNSCSCINPENSEEIGLADGECVARANERPN